mmetsp:Transcript_16657/g.45753  ORF Transcript_16657/g.45753 Transcript_16657/m.45753 type:complete len:235 (-) Transcript_16657:799-1503(-)
MSTRGATAAAAKAAKEAVVKLLFRPRDAKLYGKAVLDPSPTTRIPTVYKNVLDPAIYSYSDLRRAYLARVKELHPDRYHTAASRGVNGSTDDASHERKINFDDSSNLGKADRDQFQSLQDAWTHYETLAKRMRRVDNGGADSSFTLFGVGCSFSDDENERNYRTEIMDQAGRGWFSAGGLTSGLESENNSKSNTGNRQGASLLTMEEFDKHHHHNNNNYNHSTRFGLCQCGLVF